MGAVEKDIKEEEPTMTQEKYWATKDGKTTQVVCWGRLKDELLQVYRDAGYTISVTDEKGGNQ